MHVSVFTHRHVSSTAGTAGLGFGVNESSADAEVTEFDLAFSIQQDVGWFDISVDHTMLLLQIQQRLHDLRDQIQPK